MGLNRKSVICGEKLVLISFRISRFEDGTNLPLLPGLVLSLQNAYESPLAFDYRTLCLIPGQQCWKLYIDILVRLYSA